jgi:peptide/nickel transport system substrate-binding protein
LQRKFYALFLTAIMIAGIASPFVFSSTPASATTFQIYPTFSISLLTPSTNPSRQNWALLIANSFSSMGIQAQRVIVPWGTMYDRMLTPNASVVGKSHADGGFDMGFVGYAMSPDPDGAYGLFHGSQMAPAGQNYYLWNDTYANALSYNITHTLDAAQRDAYAKAWQNYTYTQVPSVCLFYTKEVVAFKPSFQSAPFLANHYPLWPGVELWNDTAGSTSVTIAQTGPAPEIGLVPYLTTSYYDLTAYGPIYGELGGYGLFIRNSSFKMVPYMAYSNYTVTNGGKNWTFWIQPGIKFQDGTTLDGRDYVYTIRYQMTPDSGSAGSGVYAYVSGIVCGSDIPAGIAAGYGNKTVYWAGEAGTPGASLPTNYYEVHVDERVPWAFTLESMGGASIVPASVLVNSSSGVPALSSWDPSNAAVLKTTSYNTGTTATYVYYDKTGALMPARSGPFAAGPYEWVSYSPSTFTVHETKFADYFNKAALLAAGVYKFTDYYVTKIEGLTAAISALESNAVQVLDSQYHLESSLSSLDPSWAHYVSYDAYGVQEMGFNLRHPIWGTGLGTPNGIADPAQAKAAALHVRLALEYLIPKDTIIKQILNGYGGYGITTPITRVTTGFNFAVVPRNYTYAAAQLLAKAEFELAGYSFVPPAAPTFWEAYGLLIAIVELAVIVVVAGFYFFRPRKL